MENPFITPHQKQDSSGREWGPINYGMTLMDYFAGQFLAGAMADPEYYPNGKSEIGRQAYEIAEAMLQARENKLKEMSKKFK